MNSLEKFTDLTTRQEQLDYNQIKECTDALISDRVTLLEKENFLTALSTKGESPSEIAHFIKCFKGLARNPQLDNFSSNAIDLCGTGGDRAGSFNISTFTSFVLASSGVNVIKHGNRSISSKCGSADLIEAIGIPLNLENSQINECMEKFNFAFLFAPAFHPAFKNIGPVRREMATKGLISIFNILGPMINPASPSYQILGVYSEPLVKKIRDSLHHAGQSSGYVLHGNIENHDHIKGVDELTPCGQNIIHPFGPDSQSPQNSLSAKDFGLTQCSIDELKGGNLDKNIEIMNLVLNDDASEGLKNSILMNCSLAFMAIKRTDNLIDGVKLANELISDGSVKDWLNRVKRHFIK